MEKKVSTTEKSPKVKELIKWFLSIQKSEEELPKEYQDVIANWDKKGMALTEGVEPAKSKKDSLRSLKVESQQIGSEQNLIEGNITQVNKDISRENEISE